MITHQGKAVYTGIAIGKIRLYRTNQSEVVRTHTPDSAGETSRFLEARSKATKQLNDLYKKACKEVGSENAAIFEIHQMMLDDEDYLESVENIINSEQVNAEYAVAVTGENFADIFSAMDDSYMQARAADVMDISERIIRILSGSSYGFGTLNEPCIIAADELSPSETVQLDKSKVLAFVTAKGSVNSHTAILARTMNIPAIIGVELGEECNGTTAIVDGFSGRVYINPDEKITEEMTDRLNLELKNRELLSLLKGKPTVTTDGKTVLLYANIASSKDLAAVFQNDAEGIGLFRSEFIYLGRNTFPGETEQLAIYKMVAQTMAEKRVIIRTLDIGADKQVDYFGLAKEENPAMGLRGIRLCLSQPNVFKTQLRALLQAAVYGNISIMYPMINSVSDITRTKELVMETAAELKAQGIPYRIPEQGIMIETPAAVMMSDLLAKEVDFFSIGTNDLTQYSLAIDRQNSRLDDFYDEKSEAVMRMIELTVKNGHSAGIWVGICGELAADTTLTKRFLEMGVDELSVAPPKVLSVRKIVRETNLS